jgi:CO dehydrogenase/acetyl-CoA synthase beta subunit
MGMGVFGGMGWFTELVVGAEDADVFFLVAEEDVDLFYGCVISRSWGLLGMVHVLSTMSRSIAEVKNACGGRSRGRIC